MIAAALESIRRQEVQQAQQAQEQDVEGNGKDDASTVVASAPPVSNAAPVVVQATVVENPERKKTLTPSWKPSLS